MTGSIPEASCSRGQLPPRLYSRGQYPPDLPSLGHMAGRHRGDSVAEMEQPLLAFFPYRGQDTFPKSTGFGVLRK
jgi:hypothetical protein